MALEDYVDPSYFVRGPMVASILWVRLWILDLGVNGMHDCQADS